MPIVRSQEQTVAQRNACKLTARPRSTATGGGVREKSGIDFLFAYGVLEFVKIDELVEVGHRYTKEKFESLREGKRLPTLFPSRPERDR